LGCLSDEKQGSLWMLLIMGVRWEGELTFLGFAPHGACFPKLVKWSPHRGERNMLMLWEEISSHKNMSQNHPKLE